MQTITRKTEFDILKGILIVCVVIGHTDLKLPYVDIFWFHMPAFFMITGYLTNTWITPKEVFISIKNKDIRLWKKIGKYIFPYLSYCILFFILFRPEPILKNIIRVAYAGINNITLYSYPYWFINSLFIGNLVMGGGKLYKQNKQSIIIFLIIYIIIHLNVMKLSPIPLPWGIDAALGALIFLYIGNMAKNIKSKKYYLLLLPILFIFCNEYFALHYKINMMGMIYNHPVLDLLVPVIFTYFLYKISVILSHIQGLSHVLSFLGTCSMTIYFTHAAVLSFTNEKLHWNTYESIYSAVVIGVLLHTLFKCFKITRILFLGNLKVYQ